MVHSKFGRRGIVSGAIFAAASLVLGHPAAAQAPKAPVVINVVDVGGENLARGYAIDFADRSNLGLSFNVQTYPDGLPPDAPFVPPSETAFTASAGIGGDVTCPPMVSIKSVKVLCMCLTIWISFSLHCQ